MTRFILKADRYADQPCRTGKIIRKTQATHWPIEALFDDGHTGCLNEDDYTLRRSVEERRGARLPVVSAALALFRERQSNYARREPKLAAKMRFAGEEASFCLGEARIKITAAALVAAQKAAHERFIQSMPDEQLSGRISSIREELIWLPYKDGPIKQLEADLRDELKILEAEVDRRFKVQIDAAIADGAARLDKVIADGKAGLEARIAAWLSMPVPGEQPAADALFHDPATERAMERA